MHVVSTAKLGPQVCEYFYTIETEVSLVWGQRWTLGKTVFLLLRYGTACQIALYASVGAIHWNAHSPEANVDWKDRSSSAAIPCEREAVVDLGLVVVRHLQLGEYWSPRRGIH
ncbi:hypothetical protein NMY22_g4821 [Coprinellus aureogranulatus]|nr:hypothetical protein NMY22_g4821 [Coprinellus aureogranulatus]